jgi:tetratricopeptide (TPR) repeat protein
MDAGRSPTDVPNDRKGQPEPAASSVTLSRRRKWRALFVLLTVSLAVVGAGGPHAWAWYHLRTARSALERYEPEVAQRRLARCLALWPNSVKAHLLASRAARQSGDFDEADRQLRTCQRLLDGTSDGVAFEWALLQAASGNLGEVEEFLQRQVEQAPERSPLIWEALAEGQIRLYRILDAVACLEHWLGLDPDNLRALELRGLAYQNGKQARKGADDFRQVVERAPTRDAPRWRLVLCLLDMGSYDEALPHLERIARQKPNDPDVQVRLARCYNVRDRGEQARQLLDAVLESHPEHGLALRTRGQFALADGRPEQAERWLRRAVKAWPNDYQTHWLLYRALEQQNKKEAQAQQRIAEELKGRSERLGELASRKLSEQPLDPALHYEMGALLLRSGHTRVGEGWLLSALSLDPNYRPAHAALAEHYQRQGDAKRAAEHRRQARRQESGVRSQAPGVGER